MLHSGDKKLWSEMSSDEYLEEDDTGESRRRHGPVDAGDEEDDTGESRRRHPQDID